MVALILIFYFLGDIIFGAILKEKSDIFDGDEVVDYCMALTAALLWPIGAPVVLVSWGLKKVMEYLKGKYNFK